jgi:parvulin-like peptidyl-prolyl isomerase
MFGPRSRVFSRRLYLGALLAAVFLAAANAHAQSDGPRVLARVHDQVITQQDLEKELYRELKPRYRDVALREMLVKYHLRQRDINVTEDEVDQKMEELRMALSLSRQREVTIYELPDALNMKMEALRKWLRMLAGVEKLMAQDGRFVPGGIMSAQARKSTDYYLDELLQKTPVLTDAERLQDDELARLEDMVVKREDVEAHILDRATPQEKHDALAFLVQRALLEHRLREAGEWPLGPNDDARQVRFIRNSLRRDAMWGPSGVSLEKFLKDRKGMTLEQFKRTRDFRLNAMLTRLAASRVTEAAMRKAWEEDPERFGRHQRAARMIEVSAFPKLKKQTTDREELQRMQQKRKELEKKLAEGVDFKREFELARDVAEDARRHFKEGIRFATLASLYSDDGTALRSGGDVGYVRKRSTIYKPQVVNAIFETPLNECSEPVRAGLSYFLVQPYDARTIEYADAAEEIRHVLIAELREQIHAELEATTRQHVPDDDAAPSEPSP